MPLLGFNPSAQTNTPNICTVVENFIPYDSGMEAAPSIQDIGADALAAAATGAFLGMKTDGTTRLFAGTGTKIYEQTSATAFTDRSAGGGYTAGSVWSFCQFGDATIASNYVDSMQVSTSTTFSAITGPKAKIVESVVTGGGGFVFAFYTNDAGFGVSPDRWWASALNDHTDFVPSVATQCSTGRLLGSGGPIVAAKKFGADSIVAYKSRDMFHGRYVGGDAVWQWSEIPEVGAVGPRAVCDIGFAHFIVAPSGFWIYDGARPQRIGQEVRQWFSDNVDYANISTVETLYDQASNRVFIFFRPAGSSGLTKCLVWHVGSQQWGLADYSIETSLSYVAPGVTFAGDTGAYSAAVGSFGDSPASKKLPAVFSTAHKLGTLSGVPGTSGFQTQDFGDVKQASRLTEVFCDYALRPTTASVGLYASYRLGGVELVGPQTVAFDDPLGATPGRFTLRQNARIHRCEFSFTGPVRVTGYSAKLNPAGAR